MKTSLHKSFAPFSPTLPISLGVKIAKPKGIMPFYHIISDEIPPHIQHLYKHRTKTAFIQDLDFFLKYYEAISLSDLLSSNFPKKKPYFFLSFDDGLRQVYEEAMPILLAKGIPATIFLNTDFIDNQGLMYRYKESLAQNNITDIPTFLRNYRPYMTSEQIQDWLNKGFDIGSHSKNHPLFSQLSLGEQLTQIQESTAFLAKKFQLKHPTFAFPFTDEAVKKNFFEAIYQTNIQATFGCAGLKLDSFPQHFQRIPMEGTAFSGATLIKNEYLYYLLKIPFGKNKIIRK